jgi:hypothetical protein
MNHKIKVFRYGHGFQDLDGHIWEIIYMEPSAINSLQWHARRPDIAWFKDRDGTTTSRA